MCTFSGSWNHLSNTGNKLSRHTGNKGLCWSVHTSSSRLRCSTGSLQLVHFTWSKHWPTGSPGSDLKLPHGLNTKEIVSAYTFLLLKKKQKTPTWQEELGFSPYTKDGHVFCVYYFQFHIPGKVTSLSTLLNTFSSCTSNKGTGQFVGPFTRQEPQCWTLVNGAGSSHTGTGLQQRDFRSLLDLQLYLLQVLPSLCKFWLFVETSPQAHFTMKRKNSL